MILDTEMKDLNKESTVKKKMDWGNVFVWRVILFILALVVLFPAGSLLWGINKFFSIGVFFAAVLLILIASFGKMWLRRI